MIDELRNHADKIVSESIGAVLPDVAVRKALSTKSFSGNVYLVSIGKAAWLMAKEASETLGDRIVNGVVVTKYEHSQGDIANFTIIEAGHPVPDENSFRGAKCAIEMVTGLNTEDTVLFLVSGGGSALFEKSDLSLEEIQDITKQMLKSGADITEINTIRKRLSQVKGGRFAQLCAPAQVYAIVLSDIIGDPLDMIASGPAYPDESTSEQAKEIISRYKVTLTEQAQGLINSETPKELKNVETTVTGSVTELCKAAANICEDLGYKTEILTDCLDCQAREAGRFLSSIARSHSNSEESLAFIAGGETVVKITGDGLGGRNQELALASAVQISQLQNIAIFSFGSDGTDGPTDAAGGYVDSETLEELETKGMVIQDILERNDSYHALKAVNGLLFTGPTGTNVNDVAVILIKR